MNEPRSRVRPLLALLLLVPAPSIGVTLAMLWEPTAGSTLGAAVYGFAKVWLVVFPALWLLLVERGKLSFSPMRRGGLMVGAGLGLAIAALILGAEAALGDQLIDPATVRAKAAENGLEALPRFLALAIYLTFINSLIEEYVWRWFVFRQCERVLGPRSPWIAVGASALLFTAHHTLALAAQFDWTMTLLGSLGVFIGGAAWSWCYLKFRSVWPGFVSHVIVDAAILYLAWKYIFGG